MQFFIVNCFLGLCSSLSARSSNMLMLASIRALHRHMDDHLSTISQMAWHCWSSQYF